MEKKEKKNATKINTYERGRKSTSLFLEFRSPGRVGTYKESRMMDVTLERP